MIFFSAIIAIALVRNVLGVKDQDQYYELDGTTTKAYLLIGEDDYSKVYICKQCDTGIFTDDIYDCYLRNEHTDKKFGPRSRDDPGDCKTKGYVDINRNKCYFTNTGIGGETYNKMLTIDKVPYYDIDLTDKRALTEYGWCTFKINDNDIQ
ncbi:hypothetical protein BCR36DRAFT_583687 [Piromyces finnis]|uniref:Apple domain-containing protein n=1 Tax=Piromyces finnis TaxID=1754191 RepID=A0A1Y1UW94_9FUNG|nr:hypothetical protein BCR36DRAFT_587394 [Piromyces finnis]ORX49585.1 hypothetical protein BCR36DRAFT_583687 [Piromyces finnis]|eukprot:ORX42219.1 hypothetical protein BCR36DRAFT_587394 [Piromyces finnis]